MIIEIDVVSDFVCPWCFLGKVRLAKAVEYFVAQRPADAVRVNWLPYFLNPNTPSSGEPYRAFLESKFGGPRAVDEMQATVAEAAAIDGLVFRFESIRVRPNTLRAQRLVYRAQALGQRPDQVQALVDRLFRGYFQDGLDIGDVDTLAEMAVACGERREAIVSYLLSEEDAAPVKRMAEQLGRQGVTGVPFFIINRKAGMSGAQSAAVLGAALLQAAGDRERD